MRSRIATLSVLGVGVVTALTIGATAVLVMRAHEADLVAEVQRSAAQLSRTIQRSTHHDMLENRRDSQHRQIEFIGRQEGIEVVRVYNKAGSIVFSSDADEVGRSVDERGEACYACHAAGQPLERLSIDERARIFRSAKGHRVLGMIEPIENELSCASGDCHAHAAEDTVLGVLDVAMSLEDADRRIAYGRARMAGIAAAAIAAGSLILWWLNRRLVLQPVSALVAATRRVAEGDLATRIPVSGRHELGDLQRDFNRMVERLAEARAQITQADKLASVGRLAAGVAHEINNPLTGVLTYASFLLKRADASPETREDLEVIVRETKRCREIVRGLLDFARKLLIRRQARLEALHEPVVRIAAPAHAVGAPQWEYCIPGGAFVSPGHAWARIEPSGAVKVGVDDFARKALGSVERIDPPEPGRTVTRGETLFSALRGDQVARFASPVSGRIAEVNPWLGRDPARLCRSPYDEGWVCVIEPTDLASELEHLRIGQPAARWLQEEIRRLRGGGEEPATATPVESWAGFEDKFLKPAA